MQRFVHTENLKHFRERLARETDPTVRAQIERLLKEEEQRVFRKRAQDGQG